MSPRVATGNGRVELPLDRKRRRGNGRAGTRPSRCTFVAVATDSPAPQASDCLNEANPQGRKGPSATLPYIHDGEGAVATTPARGHKTTIYQLPSTNYHLPTAIHQLPSTNCQLPSTNYQLSSTIYQLPSTNYHLPTAIYQLPTINYQLPTINYQLPTSRFSNRHSPSRSEADTIASKKPSASTERVSSPA